MRNLVTEYIRRADWPALHILEGVLTEVAAARETTAAVLASVQVEMDRRREWDEDGRTVTPDEVPF